MKWQPPIPAGALYSPDALVLGSGLALLAWCYDAIDRDGWITVNLHEIASEMGVEYWTIKRWWSALRKGPFFQAVEEHGRKGTRARLANDWIDWRLIGTEAVANMRPNTINGTETSTSSVPNTENRDVIGTETSAIMLPNNSAYKVLSTDQSVEGQEREDRDRTARTLSPAISAYSTAFPQVRLSDKQAAIVIGFVGTDPTRLECWQEVIQDYELSTAWKPENIVNMRSRFETKLKERKERSTNSRSPNGSTPLAPGRVVPTGPPPERAKDTDRARLKEISEQGKAGK